MATKGIAALSSLPPKEITFGSGVIFRPCSIDALRAAAKKITQLQDEGTPDGTYNGVVANKNKPFGTVTLNIVIADGNSAGDIQVTVVSETGDPVVGGIGKAALSERRLLYFGLSTTGNEFTVRSLIAVINFVEKLEDLVAQSGDSNAGDGTYTNIVLKGVTPFESYVWNVTKSGATYTITPTANS